MDTLLPLAPLSTLVFGLATGGVLGWWLTRRSGSRPQAKTPLQAPPPSPSLTPPSPSGQIRILTRTRDASEQANAELRLALELMEQAAGTDRLTGAWNRRRFEEGALQLISLSDRHGEDLSLILFDLDGFKRINDSFGHGVGDAVLKSVAATVGEHLRAEDSLVRWGGEEFIVLCPATALAGATLLAEKIRRSVEAAPLPQVGEVTLSLGVAQHERKESLDHWIKRADEALYRAKHRGRNRTETSLEKADLPPPEPSPLLSLVWDPALECGIPHIDHQHRQLYQLANNLLAALTSGGYPEDAKLQMQLLIAHVAQHFHDEETELAKVAYGELAAHAQEHTRLISKAKQIQRDMGGTFADLTPLLSFLAIDLMKGHLLSWDRRYFRHVMTS